MKLPPELEKIILEFAEYTNCAKCRKLCHSRGYLLNGKLVCIKCLLSLLNFLYSGLRWKNLPHPRTIPKLH